MCTCVTLRVLFVLTTAAAIQVDDFNIKGLKPKEAPEQSDTKRAQKMRNEACIREKKSLEVIYKATGENPAIAISIDEGNTARLACHLCSEMDSIASKRWFKISKNQKVSLVRLDMHDDEDLNRVTVSRGHALIISKLSKHDVGTYFCKDNEAKKPRWKTLYHVDMVPADRKQPVVTNSKTPKFKEIKLKDNNIKIYSAWEEWGECNTCGEKGERRRRGRCKVTKLNAKKSKTSSKLRRLDSVLNVYLDGIPCSSTALTGFKFNNDAVVRKHLARPDEIITKTCKEPCPVFKSMKDNTPENYTSLQNNSLLTLKVSISGPRDKEHKVVPKQLTLKETAGNTIQVYCPGAKMDTVVNWHNGTKLLTSSDAGGRVNIDAMNSLTIKDLEVTDSGVYTCTYRLAVQAVIALKVAPLITVVNIRPYLLYLAASFLCNGVIVLCFIIIKHRQRQVQPKFTQQHNGRYTAVACDDVTDDTGDVRDARNVGVMEKKFSSTTSCYSDDDESDDDDSESDYK